MSKSALAPHSTSSASLPSDVRMNPLTSPLSTSLLTIKIVAAILSCSPRSVRRLIDTKQLPAFRIGKTQTIRIRRSDVERLLVPIQDDAPVDLTSFIAERSA